MADKNKAEEPQTGMMGIFEDVLEALHTSKAEAAPPEGVDVDQTIKDLEHNLDELSQKAEALYKATGMSKEQLDEFANNPNNFSKDEWAMLEKIRAELREMQEGAEKAFSEATMGEGAAAEEAEKSKKRAKRRGRAQKKWMQG